MTQRAFGEIAQAYAEKYKALETARETFLLERDRHLERLAQGALDITGIAPTRDSPEYVTTYLPEARWSKLRTEMKRAGRAGFTVAIGAIPWFGNEGRIAFAGFVFFQMAAPAHSKIQATPLGRELGLELAGPPMFGRIASRVIPVSDPDFRVEVFESELVRLQSVFDDRDERLTAIYREAVCRG